MKNMTSLRRVKKTILVGLVLSGFGLYADTTYKIDKAHTNLGFEIDHLMISTVTGRFKDFEGEIVISDDKKKLLSIQGYALAKSIDTDNSKRDDHLRSKDFFDAQKFTKLEFSIKELDISSGSSSNVKGKLTIRGITKDVKVKVKFKGTVMDPWGAQKLAVDAETTINRKDFGLTWNEALETGGVMVGEDVKILIKAEADLVESNKSKK
ncbi:MAG: polyisoprenoid-binding protein [Leptospira sp.]|nr:polyisoprenoid-binding protein [Leptospira sp.]